MLSSMPREARAEGGMRLRPLRSESQLRSAARHVEYEIGMFLYTGHSLGYQYSSPPSGLSAPQKNIALESFLLHFRNLRVESADVVQEVARASSGGSPGCWQRHRFDRRIGELRFATACRLACQAPMKVCNDLKAARRRGPEAVRAVGLARIHSRELGAMPVWATSRFTTASAYLRSGRLPLGRYDIGVTHHSL
jgi:hypothetical protein